MSGAGAKKVVTAASTILCGRSPGHGGTVTATGEAVLTVNGAGVLLAADLLAASIIGCTNPSVSSSNIACTKVSSVGAASISTCLTVGGQGVIIDAPLAGATLGTPPGTLPVNDIKQDVLSAE